jgi:predicted outer membrane protein
MKLCKFTKRLSLFAGLTGLLFGALQPAAAQSLPIISPLYGAPPAPAALTVGLLAKARPTVWFLERASLLAQSKAAARRLRRFAQAEAGEQARAGAKLDTAAAPTRVSLDPLDSAAVLSASVDEGAETILSALPHILRTPGAQAIATDRAIAAEGEAALARLAALEGPAFDALYVETQLQGLRRLAKIYRDYSQDGDDPALLAVTVPELRQVKARIAALRG